MDQSNSGLNSDQSERRTGVGSGCLAIFGLLISVFFLSNVTMGVFELPDNLPLIGNLDEVFFSGILFWSLAKLGIRLPFPRRPPALPQSQTSADDGKTTLHE